MSDKDGKRCGFFVLRFVYSKLSACVFGSSTLCQMGSILIAAEKMKMLVLVITTLALQAVSFCGQNLDSAANWRRKHFEKNAIPSKKA